MDLLAYTERLRKFTFRHFPAAREIALIAYERLLSKPPKNNVAVVGGANIESYSQAGQDIFVQSMVKPSSSLASYVEIGSAYPQLSSNTLALENAGWKGVSLEINPLMVELFTGSRDNPAVEADALQVDYEQLFVRFKLPRDIGYLQIDIEPASNSLACLKKIPFQLYRFATVTFEHDSYREGKEIRDESRDFLLGLGYRLAVKDVKWFPFMSFEDWWVHPDLVSKKSTALMRCP